MPRVLTSWSGVSLLTYMLFMMTLGCTADSQNLVLSNDREGPRTETLQHQEAYASLTQQGKFTKATIWRSLLDPSSIEMKAKEFTTDNAETNSLRTAMETKRENGADLESSENSLPTISPLKVHLPSGPAQTTDLDEKWHTELGWSLLIDGNYEGAIAAYRQALRQNREIAEAYLGLGISLKMQDHVPAAIEAYQHAIQLKPDYAAALVHLGYIYADGEPEHRDVEKAKQLFHRAAQQGDPFAMIALRDLKTR